MPQLLAGFADACKGFRAFAEKAANAPVPARGPSPALLWPWDQGLWLFALQVAVTPCQHPACPGEERHWETTVMKRKGGWFPHAVQTCRGGQRSLPQSLPRETLCCDGEYVYVCLLPMGRSPCTALRKSGWEGCLPKISLQLTAALPRGFFWE